MTTLFLTLAALVTVARLGGWVATRIGQPAVLGELEKWVAVEVVEPASPGWAKVRHGDGATGYIRSTQVWGL